jgi:hypothetical protein
MEEFSDVSAYVELGQVSPGSSPRVDLYTEWEVKGRPSDCYGYSRITITEAGLEVRDFNDQLKTTIKVEEDTRDQEVVDEIYENLSVVQDVSSHRIFSESRVIPALHRLMERHKELPEGNIAQIIASLRPQVGLHENVRMVPQEISLELDEDFTDIYNYFFSWAVRTPMTHVRLPDEIGRETMDEPPPAEDVTGVKPYIASAPKKEYDQDPQVSREGRSDLGDEDQQETRQTGAHAEHWRTPGIGVSLKEGKIYLIHEGKKEEIDPETKDEEISARLASMAYQKENVQEGRLIEGKIQINRRDVMTIRENTVGSILEYSVEDLESMTTDELWQLAVEAGIKVHGDGVTWDREKLIDALRED